MTSFYLSDEAASERKERLMKRYINHFREFGQWLEDFWSLPFELCMEIIVKEHIGR